MTGDGDDHRGRDDDRFGYWPMGTPYVLALLSLVIIAVVLVSVAGYAYRRIGLSVGWLDGILVGSFLGSRINIPVWRWRGRSVVEPVDVVVFGVRYRVPAVRRTDGTTLAVNVGGAVIPAALSLYLVVHDHIWQHSLIAIACVGFVVWLVARPVAGVGIVAPSFLPPLAAALTAEIIGRPDIGALAYTCGTFGTLIGADILNLPRIRDLGAREASIGGAGTFDGVFLAGLLAVVIASI
jgi:uncharacterized membrane protein